MITATERNRLLAKVFTRPSFASIAKTGGVAEAFQSLINYGVLSKASAEKNPSLRDLFDEIWSQLQTRYRNEYVYKNEIANRIVFGKHSPRTASFLVELPIGRSIVDVAVFNGTSTAYEIKTEFDSPKRLETQTKDYLDVFDRVYVVTHQDKVEPIEKLLNPRVGLMVLSERGSLRTIREAVPNLANIRPEIVFNCLRRQEYLSAIQRIYKYTPDAPNGRIAEVCEELFAKISSEVAHSVFVAALKSRTTDQKMTSFVSSLPVSLRALGYATPLSPPQKARLLSLLGQPIGLSLS